MSPDRAIGLVLSCSVGAVLALGSWLLWHAHHAPPPPPPTPTPTDTATAAPTETPAGARPAAAAGYRLAGTVVGDVAFAVIESPAGRSELVRTGQIISGLGQLVAVEAHRVLIAGRDGEFALPVAAAPTVTASPAATQPTVVPTPPTPAPSGSESLP